MARVTVSSRENPEKSPHSVTTADSGQSKIVATMVATIALCISTPVMVTDSASSTKRLSLPIFVLVAQLYK